MKKKINNSKIILILTTLFVVAVVGMGSTLALYLDHTDPRENKFSIGNVTTEIEEEFEEIDDYHYKKNPRVKNIGENDCYIRMRFEVTPEEMLDRIDFLTGDEEKWGENWKEDEDGEWYYYQDIVEPGESTTALFDSLKVKCDENNPWIDFDIILYQEAVQTEVYTNSGKKTDTQEIWKQYEVQQKQ